MGTGAAELAATDRPGRCVTAARSAGDRCPADASVDRLGEQRRANWPRHPGFRRDTGHLLRAEGQPANDFSPSRMYMSPSRTAV
ncbi:hypothetical protein, partial [Micromonospora sp. NPDC048843]|uniref:hypothetical protein n=1 Tax=Micromonospora sp. NPDC048843 TaxID=3155389 RepID=UPI0034017350